MAKKKPVSKTKKVSTRGRKKGETTILCSMTLTEQKKKDCVKIRNGNEPRYDTFVSLLWWESNKKKERYNHWTLIKN